ncbi:hypothetical protein KCP75_03600 [Salmonella enterica subsp. enterica]|nr:hypothetical protein KCP75_03600 [Salmonella enterica subsp. enterica]
MYAAVESHGKTISGTAFTGFEHRHTSFFCLCGRHFTFSTTAAWTLGEPPHTVARASQTAGTISVTSSISPQSDGRTARNGWPGMVLSPRVETLRVVCVPGNSPALPLQV